MRKKFEVISEQDFDIIGLGSDCDCSSDCSDCGSGITDCSDCTCTGGSDCTYNTECANSNPPEPEIEPFNPFATPDECIHIRPAVMGVRG